MDVIVILKFLGRAALPPSTVPGLVLAGLLALFGLKKLARAVAVLAVLETSLLSLPPVSDILMAPLEAEARAAAAAPPVCCYGAIVMLVVA
jgi:hypothetical protein